MNEDPIGLRIIREIVDTAMEIERSLSREGISRAERYRLNTYVIPSLRLAVEELRA